MNEGAQGGDGAAPDDGRTVSTPQASSTGRGPASMVVQRLVEWHDVDAAGISHNTFAIRLMESAETALFERLGLTGDLANPGRRRRIAVDFLQPLSFHDRVDVLIRTTSVDETQVTFEFEVTRGGAAVMRGTFVAVPGGGLGTGAPSRAEVVRRLATSGAQAPELLR
jgi:acyl-CoA thioesterase FadM